MEWTNYHCEMLDNRGQWIVFVSAPPKDVEIPCKDQMDARACIQKWDPAGQFKWRIVKVHYVQAREIVAKIDRHPPARAGRIQ